MIKRKTNIVICYLTGLAKLLINSAALPTNESIREEIFVAADGNGDYTIIQAVIDSLTRSPATPAGTPELN